MKEFKLKLLKYAKTALDQNQIAHAQNYLKILTTLEETGKLTDAHDTWASDTFAATYQKLPFDEYLRLYKEVFGSEPETFMWPPPYKI